MNEQKQRKKAQFLEFIHPLKPLVSTYSSRYPNERNKYSRKQLPKNNENENQNEEQATK
jgi:hypothetical protein